nr:LicD family protein [Butyrivibrio sp.]
MVELDKLTFSEEWFKDEAREGFFVPEMMKRFWAAQLVVLSEIDKICKRHDIKWYADMGTLIGTIRHKGYIPWDDDFDISMLRDDWERFFKYAR